MAVTETRLGRFRLEHELGSGGHGRVWSAVDTLLGERVALKVLHQELLGEADAKARLKREVVLARRVQHHGICRVNDLHEIDGTLVISMQLAPGRALDALIDGPLLSTTRALQIIDRIADAVAAAHAQDVIHRDLKPSNIVVDDDDDIVVLDFGIASANDLGRLTEPGVVVGTLRFVAPEVLETAAASARSDLYAIGVIAWALLAGKLPWGRPSSALQLITDLENGPPDLRSENPAVPLAVANVIHQAMARDPDDRYVDVKSFQGALALASSSLAPSPSLPAQAASTQIVRARHRTREFSATGETVTVPPRRAPAPPPSTSNTRVAAFAGLGAVLVIAAGVGIAAWQQQQQQTPPVVTILEPVAAMPVVLPPPTPPPPPPPVEARAAIETADTVAVTTSEPAALPERGRPLAATTSEAQRDFVAAQSRARGLGLRRGDVPAWDSASSSAAEAVRRSPASASTAEAVKRAQQAVGGIVVDHAFVTAKLQRFNVAVDEAIRRDPKLRDKVTPAATTVARAIASKDSVAANRALNAAFAVLDRQ